MPTHTRFYYPDTQVICRPSPPEQTFQDEPAVVVEVISESTRRTDEQEKREAYLTINSLHAYILLEQDRPAATVWRRTSSGFKAELWEGLDAVVPLTEIQAEMPLAEVYETVEFPAAPEPEEP
jgi:Uma2 family endonuclease